MNSCSNSIDKQSTTRRLSRLDLLKLFLSIDRELVREAQNLKKSSANVSELDQVLTEVLRSDFSDTDLTEIASGKKSLILPGDVTEKTALMANQILRKNAVAVSAPVTLPEKSKVENVIKSLRGKDAKILVYAFIPPDSPVLKENPKVAEKRQVQINAIQEVADEISFPVEYVMKHIRNAIVDHYHTNPEQILHDVANGKDGLGITPEEITSLITAGASLVNAFKQPPTPIDWSQQSPAQPQVVLVPQNNVTNDPAYESDGFMNFIKSPLGIALGVAVGGAGAYALFK